MPHKKRMQQDLPKNCCYLVKKLLEEARVILVTGQQMAERHLLPESPYTSRSQPQYLTVMPTLQQHAQMHGSTSFLDILRYTVSYDKGESRIPFSRLVQVCETPGLTP